MKIVRIERESANDEFVTLNSVNYKNGNKVILDDPLFEVEGQKTAYDIVAPCDGYFFSDPSIEEGQEIEIDRIIGVVSDEDEYDEKEIIKFFQSEIAKDIKQKESENNENKNNSEDIEFFNIEPQIFQSNPASSNHSNKVTRLAVIGGGAGFSQVLEITKNLSNIEIVGIYDDSLFNKKSSSYGYPVIGSIDTDNISNDFSNDLFDSLIISISTDIKFREKIFNELNDDKKIKFINLIHPSVVVDDTSKIGTGNIILPYCHLGPFSRVGNNNFISSYCNIEHHCIVSSNCTFGPGVVFSGNVKVENNVKFGTGIFIEPKISISGNQFIESGSILIKDK